MMSRIIGEAERRLFGKPETGAAPAGLYESATDQASTPGATAGVARAGLVLPITDSVVAAASLIAEQLDAALIVVETHSGRTAAALSNQRGRSLILALCGELHTLRAMSLLWGVVSEPMPNIDRPRRSSRVRPEMGPRPRIDRPGRANRAHPGHRSGRPHPQRAGSLRGAMTSVQSCRMNATRSVFSSLVSFSPIIKLKNSTVSSSVRQRPSCRYGGLSLMPRRVNVLIGPLGDSATNSSTRRSCIWSSR